jgi:hypothetical protein
MGQDWEMALYTERFDFFTAANDSGHEQQDSWTLLIDRMDASVHVEHNWRDGRPTPRRQGMRIVTLAEFLRSELNEGLKMRAVATLKTARIAANDP